MKITQYNKKFVITSEIFYISGLIQSDAGERRTCVFTIQRKL